MARKRTGHDDSYEDDEEDGDPDGGLDDRELPDESDMDAPDGDWAETDDCPYCGKPVYEESVQCPHCGKYINLEDAPLRVPAWVWVGLTLALAGVMMWYLL